MVTAEKLAEKLVQNSANKRFAIINDLYTDEEGCCFLTGMTLRQLRRMRYAGDGPSAFKLGRWVYDLEDLAHWLNNLPRHTKSDLEGTKSYQK